MYRGVVRVAAYGPDGEPVHEVVEPMNDWLDNFYLVQRLLFHAAISVTVQDRTGTNQDIEHGQGFPFLEDNAADVVLEVGDNGAAFTQSDFSLGNALSTSAVSASSTDLTNRLVRFSSSMSFSNAQTIRETGIQWNDVTNTSDSLFNLLIERTVLATEVDVPAGGSISVEYELQWP